MSEDRPLNDETREDPETSRTVPDDGTPEVPAEVENVEEADPSEEPMPADEEDGGPQQIDPAKDAELRRCVEAILFATNQPVSSRRIAEVLGVKDSKVRVLIHDLRAQYDAEGRAFAIEEIAGGYQTLTRVDYADIVRGLFSVNRQHRLSQAALETLAIVAYKQPVMRVEIEDIRGVQVQPILKTLMDQGLIRVVGRADTLGRPMLYGTTQKFLLHFGLKSPKDLPPIEELKKS